MSYLKDREIWLSNVPTGNPPTGFFWKFIRNGKVVVRDSNGNEQMMIATNGNQAITGSLIVTGGITGTISSASYVQYSNVANKPTLVSGSGQISFNGITNKPTLVSGSSQVTYSGITGIPSGIVSGSAQVAQFGIFATTGSNGFNGNQSITGSLIVTGQVVAQTLNVQQVTSSIVFSSGSNIFGNSLANTQQLTGSVGVTGSFTVTTNGVELQVTNTGVNLGNVLTDSHIVSGSITINPGGLFVSGSGNVGIGTTIPAQKLQINGPLALSNLAEDFTTNQEYAYPIIYAGNLSGLGNGELVIQPRTTATRSIRFATRTSGAVSSTNPDTRMIIRWDGNVGIGTTSPSNLLHVYGTDGNSYIRWTSDVATTGTRIGYNGTEFRIDQQQNADITLRTNGNERMRITSNGNTGIGTTDPTSGFNARLAVRNEDAANNPTLVLFKNINSASSEDIFRVQSWNGAFNTVASIRANGSAAFSSTISAGSHITGTCTTSFNGDGIRVIASATGAGGSQPGIGYWTAAGSKRFINQLDVSTDTWGLVNATGTNLILVSQSGAATFSSSVAGYGITLNHTSENLRLKMGAVAGGVINIQGEVISSGGAYSVVLNRDGGNVGIGINPSHRLDVLFSTTEGNRRFLVTQDGVKLIRSGDNSGWAFGYGFYRNDGTNLGIGFGALGGGDGLVRYFIGNTFENPISAFLPNGNVLIGTTTDSGQRLQVNGSGRFLNSAAGAATVSTSNSNNSDDAAMSNLNFDGNRLRLGVLSSDSTYGCIGTNGGSTGLAFVTHNGTSWGERMRITPAGVLVNQGGVYDTGTSSLWIARQGGNNRILADGNGYIYMPFLTTGSGIDDLGWWASSGSSWSSNGMLMRISSSARYKKNIRDIEIDTSKIYDLRTISYENNENTAVDGLTSFGLLAEDVAEKIPLLATFNNEGLPEGVQYKMLSVLILEELKKLKAENESLKSRIEILEQ